MFNGLMTIHLFLWTQPCELNHVLSRMQAKYSIEYPILWNLTVHMTLQSYGFPILHSYYVDFIANQIKRK
jgi:hypothetical protein